MRPTLVVCALGVLLVMPAEGAAQSAEVPRQSLNWEGQTGGMVTPFAYTTRSRADGMSLPAVAFHVMPAGDVVGTRFQLSITAGLFERLEIGYTKAAVSSGSDEDLGRLFDRGFQIVHAKVNLLPENAGGSQAPAVSAGVLIRYQQDLLEDSLGTATRNADIYVVTTKTLTAVEDLPVVLSGGVRMTNATPFGFAGDAPDWTARAFAAGGVVIADRLFVGAEFLQQPAEVDGVPDVHMPATITYFARLLPGRGRSVSVSAGVVRLAGDVGSGRDVKAEHVATIGVTVHF